MKLRPKILLPLFLVSFCCQAQNISEIQQLLQTGNEQMAIGQYSEAIDTYKEALKQYPPEAKKEGVTVGKLHLNIGKGHMALQEMDSAQVYLNKALEMLQFSLGDQHSDVADAHHNLGMVLKDKGQAFGALTHYQKALVAYQQNIGTQTIEVARVYNSMGHANFYVRNFILAVENHQQAVILAEQLYGKNHIDLAEYYVSLGLSLQVFRRYDEAITHLEEAIQLYLDHEGYQDPDLAYAYFILGLTNRGMGQYQKAITYFKQALQIEESVYGMRHPDVARTQTYIGIVYGDLQNYDEALLYFQKALISCTRDFSDKNVYANPMNEHIILARGRLMDVLNYKATILYWRYLDHGENRRDLIAAKESMEIFLQFVYEMRKGQQNWADIGVIMGKSKGIMELYYDIWQELYGQTQDLSFIDQAFWAGEFIRSTQLVYSLRSGQAIKHFGLPQELEDLERKLEASIREANGALTIQRNIDTSSVFAIRKKLIALETSRDSLIEVFQNQYPRYFDLKYEMAIPTMKDIQAVLPDSTLLVEFFLGRMNLFIFGINKEKLRFYKVPIDREFASQLENFRQINAQPPDNHSDPDAFEALGHELYQSLLAPVLSEMSRPKLIIIPDAQLGYFPFELLATDTTEGSTTFAQLPYLIRKYQLQVEYSATLLMNTPLPSDQADQGYLGYAPDYGAGMLSANETVQTMYRGLREGFAPLKHNRSEIQQSSELFEGTAKLGMAATESSFKSGAGNSAILHLAMHALVNDSVPEYSGLVFAADSDSVEDHFLYAYELYGMRLKTNLAVLSACETGLGKLQMGEGIMSLAHAFKYAGCPNIVMSLWKADDQATAEIMVDFFTHLRNGLPKAAALRKAKLDYLAQAPAANSHPFYWGTFVLIGDDQPIEMPQNWMWLLGGLVIAGGLIFYRLTGINRGKSES
ncbi:MAG: CHAT domain-containing tetratricopeptide repeat protein [Bacteroidota bacterium]